MGMKKQEGLKLLPQYNNIRREVLNLAMNQTSQATPNRERQLTRLSEIMNNDRVRESPKDNDI